MNDFFNDNDNDNNNITNTVLEDLELERDNAIDARVEKNDMLFKNTIEHWIALVFISFLIYLIFEKYKHHQKLIKIDGAINVPTIRTDEESLELVEINTYRRSSIDDEHLEINLINEQKVQKVIKVCTQIVHYFLFGSCIIAFQYVFFQNVVAKYDPLSIQEVKYIIYKQISPKLENRVDIN